METRSVGRDWRFPSSPKPPSSSPCLWNELRRDPTHTVQRGKHRAEQNFDGRSNRDAALPSLGLGLMESERELERALASSARFPLEMRSASFRGRRGAAVTERSCLLQEVKRWRSALGQRRCRASLRFLVDSERTEISPNPVRTHTSAAESLDHIGVVPFVLKYFWW